MKLLEVSSNNFGIRPTSFAILQKLGAKLAAQHKAPKTLALIKNPDSLIGDIFNTASEEIGVDKLAPIILVENKVVT
ncbi:MAG: hypothetical protein OES09_08285 [Gammaproteobacteria bacterium]|nr:hypothetical protein [Gammaproteobacteria bacterium]